MAKLTIVGPNLPDQSKGNLHVHAADCKDLTRGQYRQVSAHEKHTEEHDSLRSVVDSFYGPDAGSFYVETYGDNVPVDVWREYLGDFYIAPCVDLPDEVYEVDLKFRFVLRADGQVQIFTRKEFPTWENFHIAPNLKAAEVVVGEEIVLRVARQQDGTE